MVQSAVQACATVQLSVKLQRSYLRVYTGPPTPGVALVTGRPPPVTVTPGVALVTGRPHWLSCANSGDSGQSPSSHPVLVKEYLGRVRVRVRVRV